MIMSFKEELSLHFKNFDASPLLFVGSGLSRRYLGLECWSDLLRYFSKKIDANYLKLQAQSNGNMAELGQLLADEYSKVWWESEEAKDIQEEYKEHFLSDSSPLKIEISRYIKSGKFIPPTEELKNEIALLKKANIDGVITTNWDMFLESLFPKFTPFIGQDGLIVGRSHGIAEIYKIHGCVSEPNSLVLTSGDYSKFRKKNPYISSKLISAFIERPIIFLGYSLTDEYIAEILEEIVDCFPDSKIDLLRDKLFFVEWDESVEVPEISNSILHKKIPVKLIRASSFSDIYSVLSETKKRIPAHLFRQIKDELYDLVLTDDPKGQLYVRDASDLDDESGLREYVVGYGAISKIKQAEESLHNKGLVGLKRMDIVREVIFETGQYDDKEVVENVFPLLCKGNVRLPIFHYLNKSSYLNKDGNLSGGCSLCDGASERFDITLETFRGTSIGEKSRAHRIPALKESVNELYAFEEIGLFLRMLPYMEYDLIKSGLNDLRDIIKKHIDDPDIVRSSSQMVKVICVYDYVKNSNR
jgi:hypothetical protein